MILPLEKKPPKASGKNDCDISRRRAFGTIHVLMGSLYKTNIKIGSFCMLALPLSRA
jgi:hypothetical protein